MTKTTWSNPQGNSYSWSVTPRSLRSVWITNPKCAILNTFGSKTHRAFGKFYERNKSGVYFLEDQDSDHVRIQTVLLSRNNPILIEGHHFVRMCLGLGQWRRIWWESCSVGLWTLFVHGAPPVKKTKTKWTYLRDYLEPVEQTDVCKCRTWV